MLKDLSEREWNELISVTLVELGIELNPVKTNVMEEALHAIHHEKNTSGSSHVDWPQDDKSKKLDSEAVRTPNFGVLEVEGKEHEHIAQLTVSQRQGPKSQVTSSVGNSSEGELNSLNT